MTKAERIFKETRYQCLKEVNAWGFEEVGFNNICARDDKESVISTRTLNDLDKLYERAVKMLAMDYKLGVLDKEKATKEAQVLRKVRLTLDNARKNFCK